MTALLQPAMESDEGQTCQSMICIIACMALYWTENHFLFLLDPCRITLIIVDHMFFDVYKVQFLFRDALA